MKHLGILAHSTEGAALCFLEYCREGSRRIGPYEHPDVTLDCIALARSMPSYESGDLATVRDVVSVSVERLKAAGADYFVCPDNTVHEALELPGTKLALPGLHIAEVVASRAADAGFTRVGILGTRFLMEGPIYPAALGSRGIDAVLPPQDDRETIHRIIFDELLHGAVTEGSRAAFVEIIERLSADGCDAVALVCTEIPMIVTPDVSPLPTLDSPRLIARAAFDVAVEEHPMPEWLGGPVR